MHVRLHRLAATRPVARAVGWLEALERPAPRILRVLTYHRVPAPEPFAQHLQHLLEHASLVSPAEVLAALDGEADLPGRNVLVTFDDAYRDFATVAWPLLRRAGCSATLFVPTSYPDQPRVAFWWERIAAAFRETPRRAPLAWPGGRLDLSTSAARARSHACVKAWLKDLPHRDTLAATDELCAGLHVAPVRHDVLGWDELRGLAREGVSLGAHSRTHPRLDRIAPIEAVLEALGSLHDLEREVPGLAPLFAYPDGRHDDRLVECLRRQGVRLAFTTRRGANDLTRCDPLRLRRIAVDASDSLAVFRAKLALVSGPVRPLVQRLDPPGRAERGVERTRLRLRRRGLRLRALDAALTAGRLPPRGAWSSVTSLLAPRTRRYERLGRAVGLALRVAPGLERALLRALLAPEHLPLPCSSLSLMAFGSGATVFRLQPPRAAPPLALKIYRRTLGLPAPELAQAARSYRSRYRQLARTFGDVLHPGTFLVLRGPLRGAPAVACLQRWIAEPVHDLLALDDGSLLEFLRAERLGARFAAFARSALGWHAQGSFPDLLGRGNLVAVRQASGTCLRLVDYGILAAPRAPRDRRAEAVAGVARRLATLAHALEGSRRDALVR
ncbi:MAG TPA: polysaccharide deacetylase family protein [Planctomycetota bacterium]